MLLVLEQRWTRRPARAYQEAVKADAPLVYWRLNESSGTTAADASGNGRAGTYSGGFTLAQAGAIVGDPDKAASFDGVNGHVDGGAFPTAQTDNWTVEAIVNPAALPAPGGVAVIAGITFDDGVTGNGWAMCAFGSNLAALFSGVAIVDSGVALTTGAYTQVVARRQSGTTSFFVNGLPAGATSATAPAAPAGSATLWAGGQNSIGRYFNGKIDEAAVYGTALSAARILYHYNRGAGH